MADLNFVHEDFGLKVFTRCAVWVTQLSCLTLCNLYNGNILIYMISYYNKFTLLIRILLHISLSSSFFLFCNAQIPESNDTYTQYTNYRGHFETSHKFRTNKKLYQNHLEK